MTDLTTTALRLENVSKSYPGVQALDRASITCQAGEVHAVVGENGSGKSTLVSIASGVVAADSGAVEICGTPLSSADPAQARRLGLTTVYQDNSLVPELSVGRNLYLACPPEKRPPYGRVVAWASEYVRSFDLHLDPSAAVAELSLGLRQLLEIVKALLVEPRVLMLDEPTNALGGEETAWLAALVRRQAQAGTAVIYISHRLREVTQLADRITVLRDGVVQGTFDADGLSEDEILSLMVGADLAVEFPAKLDGLAAGAALHAEGLGGPGFGPIDLAVRPGEILGLAGAEGNGQRPLLRALGGLAPATGTLLDRNGRHVRLGSPARAFRAGIMSLSGDRLAESVFPALGVSKNMTMPVLASLTRRGVIDRRREQAAVLDQVEQLNIVAASLEQTVGTLSGGNQQKVVLGRSFVASGSVLLIDEPTQGVDAAARIDLYRALRRLAASGVAIVVNSADAMELAGLCDRVLVLSRGRVTGELAGAELTEQAIVTAFMTATQVVEEPGSQRAAEGRRWRVPAAARPLGLVALLLALVALYTSMRSETFASTINIQFLLLNAIPLILLAAAQLNVLLIGGIDLSVGSQVSLTTVLASFWLAEGRSDPALGLGFAGILVVGLGVGAVNGLLVQRLKLSPIIVTVATLSILQGVALTLRETSGGIVADSVSRKATWLAGFVPVAFLVVVVVAMVADWTLERTAGGLAIRAIGFRPLAARRIGLPARLVELRAYVLSSLLATVAGLFIAVQIGTGDANVGAQLTLGSVAAAVLGGASLFGGRGYFTGCVLGGGLLALITNVIPFLQLPDAFYFVVTGGLTLLAISAYSASGGWTWLAARAATLRRQDAGPSATRA